MKVLVQAVLVSGFVFLAGCDIAKVNAPQEGAAVTEKAPVPQSMEFETEPDPYPLFEKRAADLVAINDALQAYKADRGAFPTTDDNWVSIVQKQSHNWLPELVPDYLPEVPRDPESKWDFDTPQYVYRSNGAGFKLIARKTGDCEAVRETDKVRVDPQRQNKVLCWAYGFWTEDYTDL